MPGPISGLRSQSTGTTTLRIGDGSARDTTDTVTITVPTGTTRDVSLTASGAGGLDTGSIQANTSYALWIVVSSSGTVAGTLSLSFSAPTVSSGSKFRRIGAIVTDADSQLAAFTQSGNSNARTVAYSGTPTVLRLVNAQASTSWTDLDLAPGYPISADQASIEVTPSGGDTQVRGSSGDPPITVSTGPTVLGLTPPAGTTKGSWRTAAGASTTIWLRGFSEQL